MIKIEYIDREEFEKNATWCKPSKALDELFEQILKHQQKYRDYISKQKLK